MNIKKLSLIGGGLLLAIVALAVCISAKFSLSNITSNPYAFITSFFSQWSPALSAAGTLIVAFIAYLAIHENRRRQEQEERQYIRAVYDEIFSNHECIYIYLETVKESAKRVGSSLDEAADGAKHSYR